MHCPYKYLIQYICRNAGGISKYYPVIADEFPKVESQKSRLSRLKESFGEITGLYDDVPDIQSDVSNGIPLPVLVSIRLMMVIMEIVDLIVNYFCTYKKILKEY